MDQETQDLVTALKALLAIIPEADEECVQEGQMCGVHGLHWPCPIMVSRTTLEKLEGEV